MNKKRLVGVYSFVFVFFLVVSFVSAGSGVDTSSLLLKVSVKDGGVANRGISVSSDEGGEFLLEVSGISGVTLSDTTLFLEPGEIREVGVKLDSSLIGTGVHVGVIKIITADETQLIPVVFEVESEDVFFDINLDIPPQYTEIGPGERLMAQLKIYDLTWGGTQEGLGPTNVDIDYYIYNVDGSMINSERETVVINRQNQITKSFNFPLNIKEGDYIFVSTVKYKTSLGSSSALFSISEGGFSLGDSWSFGNFSGIFENGLFLLIFVAGIFFFMIVFLFVYLVRDRDKLLLEMKKINFREMNVQRKFILDQQGVLIKKHPAKKAEIKKEVRNKISRLKEKHKNRVDKIDKLSKGGSTDDMNAQLKSWKKKGYNTSSMDYKLKGLTKKDMNSLLNKWKTKYKG